MLKRAVVALALTAGALLVSIGAAGAAVVTVADPPPMTHDCATCMTHD